MFWQSVGAADRELLTAMAHRRRFPKGAPLFHEGDASDSVMIVESGWLKVTRGSNEGQVVLIEIRGPGEIVGELAMITGKRRSATVIVVELAVVLVLPSGEFRRLLSERASISSALLVVIAHRLQHSVERQLESGTATAFERVCRRLLELADLARPSGDGVGEAVEILSPLSQQEIAEWIGMSRDAVVLALQRLRELRWIETGRRRIRILDRDALARCAQRPL